MDNQHLSPEMKQLIELYKIYRITEPMESDLDWWNIRAHVISSINGGSQYCLTNYKGKR